MLITSDNINEACKAMRTAAGLTQAALVARMVAIDKSCGYNREAISRLEHSRFLPSFHTISLIAKACGYKIVLKKGK